MQKNDPPLTELQMETLGAAINGTLDANMKPVGKKRYLRFALSDGREVTRRVISLRRRGLLYWGGPKRILPTDEGLAYWRNSGEGT